MKWLKCIVTGLFAVFITVFVVPISLCTYYMYLKPPPVSSATGREVAIGWDPVGMARLPQTWAILCGAFAIGFLWEYRWLKRRKAG